MIKQISTDNYHQQPQKPIKKTHKFTKPIILIIFLITIPIPKSHSSHPTPPPLPILPIPTSQQLSWQLTEMAIFFHFGTNTYTDSEWGTGHANPTVFNPTALNATQWVNVAKNSGFSRVILTAKHHDGYGEIREVWLDGAKGEGEKDMEYFFDDWFSVIHQLQPKAVIFSDAGPDVRWVGDEAGYAGNTCWSLFNQSAAKIGDTDREYSGDGDPFGQNWVPAECDVSIRPGWFWHASETPKPALTLLDLYYKSVGRNCVLLLNVPPNSSGLISQEDILVLQEFQEIRNSIFSHNLAKHASISASSTRGSLEDSGNYGPQNVLEEGIYSYWAPDKALSDWIIYLDFEETITFNVLMVQEPIQMGQRIIEFHLDLLNEGGKWEEVTGGTTVGYKRLLRFPSVKTSKLRLVVDKSRADPLISYLGIYMDPFSVLGRVIKLNSGSQVNGSEPLRPIIRRNNDTSYI